MRFVIAMLIGAGVMFALGTSLRHSAENDVPETRLRRPSWPANAADDSPAPELPDPRDINRPDDDLAAHVAQMIRDNRQRDQAVQVGHEESDEALVEALREIQRKQFELDRQKAQLEAQLLTGVTLASVTQSVDSPQSLSGPDVDASHRKRVLTQVYHEMSADSVASIVGELLDAEQTDSAMSVLEILDGRKASKVLAAIAGRRPQVALMLTDRLVEQRTR